MYELLTIILMKLYGEVKQLWRYPVKSLLGESRTELSIDRRGVVGDRWFAISNSRGKFGSSENTRRFCKIEGLFDFQAKYDDETLIITFPDGRTFKDKDPNLTECERIPPLNLKYGDERG